MINTLLTIACVNTVIGSSVSQGAALITQQVCVGVQDMTSIDPAEADVVSSFVGTPNYLETVCRRLYACVAYLDSPRLSTMLNAGI